MRGRRIWCFLAGAVTVIVVVVVVGLIAVYSGLPDVSALHQNPRPVDWALGMTSDRSVARRANGLRVPALDDPAKARAGAGLYQDLCIECHGAPGISPEDLAKGLNPPPPRLTEGGDLTPAELFRFTREGVRMTGMPGWGATQTDAQIWELVAFVRRLPKMTEAQYRALARGGPQPGS